MRMYSITHPQTHLNITLQSNAMYNILDDPLPFRLPWTMALQVQNQSTQTNIILDAINYSKVAQCDSIKLYLLTNSPITLNWYDAYQTDTYTSSIFLHLQ